VHRCFHLSSNASQSAAFPNRGEAEATTPGNAMP